MEFEKMTTVLATAACVAPVLQANPVGRVILASLVLAMAWGQENLARQRAKCRGGRRVVFDGSIGRRMPLHQTNRYAKNFRLGARPEVQVSDCFL